MCRPVVGNATPSIRRATASKTASRASKRLLKKARANEHDLLELSPVNETPSSSKSPPLIDISRDEYDDDMFDDDQQSTPNTRHSGYGRRRPAGHGHHHSERMNFWSRARRPSFAAKCNRRARKVTIG
jgi:hypothetical protein